MPRQRFNGKRPPWRAVSFADATPRAMALWLLTLLSFAPLSLYAYLGHFSRLMIDDYGFFATALWLGFRDNFNYWRSTWHAGYSFALFHDLLSVFDPARLPPLFPGLIIAAWLAGLAWLISLMLRQLGYRRDHLPISLTLAALSVFAGIQSFHSLESFYWYSSSVRHTLPLGFMLLFLAAALEFSERLRSRTAVSAAALAAALTGFLIAGFSELNALIQLTYYPLAMAGLHFAYRGRRARTLAVLSAGFFGSLASLPVFISAPGFAKRMASAESLQYASAIRELPGLALETAAAALEYAGHRGSLAGFMLLLAAGLCAGLLSYRPNPARVAAPRLSLSLASAPLWLGIFVQLVFLPILWARRDSVPTDQQLSLIAALCLDIVSLATLSLILWRKPRLDARLRQRKSSAMDLSLVMLAAAFALLAWTQHGATPAVSAAYLFSTVLSLLLLLAGCLLSLAPDPRWRRFGLITALTIPLAACAIALPVAVGLFGLGFVYTRSLAFSALMQVLPGLIWGVYIGCLVQRSRLLTAASQRYVSALLLLCVLVIACSAVLTMAEQAQLIPDFAVYASDWDARHAQILELREKGAMHIEVLPYRYDMTSYITTSGQAFGGSHPYYYGVESITVLES